MRSENTDLKLRPNTLKENKRVLCELRRRSKIDRKSLDETNRLVAKFNAKNALGLSKNAGASLGQKQEKKVEKLYGALDGFAPGSWWGIRMDCSRDGVHEPFNQDLREGPFGVVSLCTSHSNIDNDVDLGDSLTLTGDEYRPEGVHLQPLLKNYHNRLPIRLIRSYNLSNDYAPKTGYRYDGLYSVVGCWIGLTSDAEKRYKFALARLPHQAPPSWQPSRRSTASSDCRVQDGSLTVPDEETTRNIRPRSLMTRCPLPKLNSPSSQESTIVTRCTSKKSNLLPNETSSASPVCKFQNTNISIRTDLYDSSNVASHEPRKSIPMTFCRTYKNPRLPGRPTNHSNVVTLNLNSCGPCPRDNAQSSLIQSRSGNPKFATDQTGLDHVEAIAKLPRDRTESRTNFNEAETVICDERNRRSSEPKPTEMEDSTDKMAAVSLTGACAIAVTKDRNGDESTADNAAKESHADLDSLTPDEMLNFIVEQKCDPRAKLLIGSVIGLATGESTILRAYESLMSRNNIWPRNDDRGETKETKSRQGNADDPSSLDYEAEKNSTGDGEARTVSKTLPTKRAPGESKDRLMRKRSLRRTRVSKRLMIGTEKKLNAGSRQKNAASQRLRKSKLPDAKKSQQPFSKSTAAKKSKSAKKRRGELANLVIDAKIGPLIRGPRNRRLRCKAHIFAKKLHSPEASGGKKEIAEVPTRKSKVAESRFTAANKRAHANESNCSRDASKTRSAIGEKRKLSRSRDKRTSDRARKIYRSDSPDNGETQRVKMVDAATQCTTGRRDVTTSVDRDVIEKPLNTIKIEWIDVDDVKSEMSEDGVDFQDSRVSSIVDRASSQAASPFRRSSAFVPVNVSDRDFRIARLRSIGFKPIRPDGIFGDDEQPPVTTPDDEEDSPSTSTEVSSETPAVASREVDELFNKYTSEETTTVGYMDHELRYQDIEDEENGKMRPRKNRHNYGSARRGGRKTRDQTESTRDIVASSNEADSEVPWHGWKKFVTDKQAQWIGW